MQRRGFLEGILALGITPAIVEIDSLMKIYTPPRLTVWGDGIRDDTEAIQAFMNGEEVYFKKLNKFIQEEPGKIVFPSGNYAISDTLILPGKSKEIVFTDSCITGIGDSLKDKPGIIWKNPNFNSVFRNNTFIFSS